MPRDWTEEQRRAIYAEGDLLVSAAAGAGKTAVLTERIARLVSEGVPIEKLLVVTFTNAAAAEMKERIEKRLRELADAEPDAGRASALIRAAMSCARANISTLHSFCMNVLRRNYHEAGIDPAFKAAETLDAELIAKKAIDEVLEEAFAENEKQEDPGLAALIETVKDDERLEELLRKLYTYAVSRPDPEGWLDMAVRRYAEDFRETSREIARSLVETSRGDLELFLTRARLLSEDMGEHPTTLKALSDDILFIEELCAKDDYDAWAAGLGNVSFSRLGFKRGADESEKAPVNSYRDELKKLIAKLKKTFSHTLAEEERAAALLSRPIVTLRKLVSAFAERFAELKEEEGLIDFSDMEQLTLKVLKDPGIAEEYRSRFDYVFVDEYQDVNPAQEAILSAVSNDNRFMVGDVKQSIYRFRQAEPAIFMEKYRTYNGSGGHTRIDLNRNFRSRSAVLDAANLLFSQLMRGGSIGEIDYSDNAALVPSDADAAPGEVELTFIETEPEHAPVPGEEEEDDSEERSDARIQAAYAAKRILETMENCVVHEKDGPRSFRFSDFAVLLRSAKTVAADWIKTFEDSGIPCAAASGEGFYGTAELRLFMDILRVTDNRRQDIPLLAAMRSPVFGFTEEELVFVRRADPKGDMLSAVKAAAEDPAAPSWSIKCAAMLQKLDEWRERSRLSELGDFVASVLDETKLGAYVASLRGGGARVQNLETLVSLANRFAEHGGDLSGFIKYMDRAAETMSDPSSQPPTTDAVKIMTIHASKGLEFNTVILGDITKKFRRSYNTDIGIFDAELGIGLCSVSGDRENRSMLQRAIALRESRRLNAEEMRLLYVAMTRAKERLIILGAKKNADKFIKKHASPLNGGRIMKADHYADWILGAYFPGGTDTRVVFPHGGELKFSLIGCQEASGSSRSMTEEEFVSWLQEASFLDTDALGKRFGFRYPHEADVLIPSKLSVTGLSREAAEIRDRPRFMEGPKELTAAEKGTLTHRLLQLVSVRPHTEESVAEELSRLTGDGVFTEDEAKAISIPSVAGFFGSALGRRMIASGRVEREREFNIMLGADELMDTNEKTPVMLQGVIDCCFIEDGEWVLIDHKTSRVDRDRTARAVAERYRKQLELYSKALERLTGIPVKERYVYLLSSSEAVEV